MACDIEKLIDIVLEQPYKVSSEIRKVLEAVKSTESTDLEVITPDKVGWKLSVDKKGKDQGKADLANRFIGYGVRGTSTYQYEQDAKRQGIPVNYEGTIDENTIAFVSVNGNNKASEDALYETSENIKEVLEMGGTVIMDSTEDASRYWNRTGEAVIQDIFQKPDGQTSKGYNYWGKDPESVDLGSEPFSDREALLENEVIKRMGGTVSISIGNEKNFKEMPIKRLSLLDNFSKVQVSTDKGTYTFKVGKTGGYKSEVSSTGKVAYAKWLGEIASQVVEAKDTLGSEDYKPSHDKSIIHPKWVGKIILANSGTGKTKASNTFPDVVDGDTLLVKAANYLLKREGKERKISRPSELNDAWIMLGKGSKDSKYDSLREDVYRIQADLAKKEAAKGKTVLIASARKPIIDVADVVFFKEDIEALQASKSSSDRENILIEDKNKVANKTNKFKEAIKGKETILLKSDEYVSDILSLNKNTPTGMSIAIKKPNKFKARLVTKEEKVVTFIDGEVETTNIAKVGDYIVTGKKGEKWVVPQHKFSDRYKILSQTNMNEEDEKFIKKFTSVKDIEQIVDTTNRTNIYFSSIKSFIYNDIVEAKSYVVTNNHKISPNSKLIVFEHMNSKVNKFIDFSPITEAEKATLRLFLDNKLRGPLTFLRKVVTPENNNEFTVETKPSVIEYMVATKDINFTASWGEDMIAHPGDALVYENGDLSYRIEKETFYSTYTVVHTSSIANKAEPKTIEANLRKDALKSNEGMKDIINELYTGDENYRKYVLGLLDTIDESFIPKLKLYINKEAERNSGVLTGKGNIIVDVAPNMDNSDKSPTEVYIHEIMHAITKFAINSDNPDVHPIRRQLEQLRDEAAKLFSYKDFMPEQYTDFKAAKEAAEARYDYIFNQPNSLHEFVAYGMTNPKVMNKLRANKSKREGKKHYTLFQWLFEQVSKLLDKVLGKTVVDGKSMKAELQQLTFELMKYNNEAVKKVEEKGKRNAAITGLIKSNEVVSKFLEKVRKSLEGEPGKVPTPPKNGTAIENTMYTLRYFPQLMLREDLRGHRNAILSAFFMKPEGTVQNIIRDVEVPTELERLLEQTISDAGTIDRMRELLADIVEEEVHNSFTRKLTKIEEEAITLSAIDTDLSAVYNKYTKKELVDILTDEEVRNKKIKEVTTELRKLDSENFNWNNNQAHGLGYYMATGKAGYAQNLNAYNIASGIQSNHRRKPNKKVISKIDELATLIAVKYTPEASNALLRDLIVEQKVGIDKVMELHEISKKEARDKVFETPVNIIKGYSKELFDDTIDVKIKPVKYEEVMKREGYELVEVLEKASGDTTTEPMAIYRSKLYVNSSYNRMATRMTDMNKRGTSIKDIGYMSDEVVSGKVIEKRLKAIKEAAAKEAEAMTKDSYTFSEGTSMTAILNQDGQIVDYRYMMGKRTKQELLGQDTTIARVLGRTIASINDKVDTDIHNQMVLDIILADMKDNYEEGMVYGKNKEQYIKIEKNSPNKEVQEIYKLLPNHLKQAIHESDYGHIAVRRDMLHSYFGFRDKSIIDFFGIHHITPQIIQKWIRFAEKLWMEIVSISKVDIVIRTPMVFIGNVISNIMYSIVNNDGGVFNLVGVMRIAKMQIRNAKAVMEYVEAQREIERLKLKAVSGDKAAQKRVEMLEAELTRNPVHDLMVAGMYQAIIDDLKKQEYKPHGKFAKRLEGITDTIPEFVKTGVSWMYLDANTSYFKLMTTATQMSDFAARATEYQLLKERGVNKEEALNTVLDAFVNYSKPASAFEEYLNNMGLFMFTKYMKRIHRAIVKSGKDKPVNVLLSILAQEAFFDVDDIQEQHVVSRSFKNLDQDMMEHFMRAVTPTTLQFAGIVK